jgi:hypothetical protein
MAILLNLQLWERHCKMLCNKDNNYVIGDIFKMNEPELDIEYFKTFENKTCILVNPDCDFPPPKYSHTYEFDNKYIEDSNVECNSSLLSYQENIDTRIIEIIEKFNINILCYSCSVYHKNIKCIPLGVTWQVQIPSFVLQPIEKTILCYANFGIPTINRWFGNPRADTFSIIKNKNYITIDNTQLDTIERKKSNNYNNYFNRLKKSKFSICPRGCGIDSYRVYDSILCDCIPIMLNNNEYYNYFHEFPILFINDYEDISEEFLHEKWNKINIQQFDKSKLTFEYWRNYV